MVDKKDLLALERSKLANERTFLAYFRTSIVFVSSGFAMLKLDFLLQLDGLAYFLIILSPIVLIFGVSRYYYTKRRFKKLMESEAPEF